MGRFPLLPRKKDTDKRSYGHVFVLAGSRPYPGAALIAARSALLSGAGLVTLGTVRSNRPAVLKRFPPEVMPLFFEETRAGGLSQKALPSIRRLAASRKVNAAVIGPGLTRERSTARLVRSLVRTLPIPIVLDADGLNAFAGRPGLLKRRRAPLVLTPHAGEFARLFGRAWPKSPKKRAELAKKLSRSYDVVLVLKGPGTLVVYRDRMAWNKTGNPGMAKGGTGDALTGIIAAFIAQGMDPYKAAVWGVHFHGRAGDLAAKKTGALSLTASDLIDFLKDCWSSSAGRAADL